MHSIACVGSSGVFVRGGDPTVFKGLYLVQLAQFDNSQATEKSGEIGLF
jgi:hypothetical protein